MTLHQNGGCVYENLGGVHWQLPGKQPLKRQPVKRQPVKGNRLKSARLKATG